MRILQTLTPSAADTAAADSLEKFSSKISSEIDSLAQMKPEEFISAITEDTSSLFSQETLDYLIDGLVSFGIKLLAALAIYAIGAWIIKKCKHIVRKIFEKRKTEKSLASFIMSVISITMTIILIVITISTLGINTTSVAALLASGGVAIGFAMSGTLQNLAGGVSGPAAMRGGKTEERNEKMVEPETGNGFGLAFSDSSRRGGLLFI